MPWVTKRSLLISTTLIALLLWRVPGLAAEGDRSVGASMGIVLGEIHDMITATASREGVDPALVKAIVAIESDFKPRAISRKGAKGLMQLMPETASRYGVSNPFDPQANLTGGIRHLRDLLRYFSGDLPRTLAAYNAGTTAVLIYRGIPPYDETRKYVQRILARYRPTKVPSSPAPGSSIGRQVSEVAQVGEEARAQDTRRDDAPSSSAPGSSIRRRVSEVAQVGEEARARDTRRDDAPSSPAPGSSNGKQASEVAQVGEEARAQDTRRDDASPVAISAASAAKLRRMDTRHRLTEISRTSLVQMREARITRLRSVPPSQ